MTQTSLASGEPPEQRLTYSIEEAARALGIGRTLVLDLLRTGRLRSALIGRRRVIRRAEVERFLAEREEEERHADTVFLSTIRKRT